jgi:small subunit ribosomal protein S4
MVNGVKANVPSMLIKAGDVVEIAPKSKEISKITGGLEANAIREVPAWLEVDKNSLKAVVRDLPKRDDITSTIEERLVVELYSK